MGKHFRVHYFPDLNHFLAGDHIAWIGMIFYCSDLLQWPCSIALFLRHSMGHVTYQEFPSSNALGAAALSRVFFMPTHTKNANCSRADEYLLQQFHIFVPAQKGFKTIHAIQTRSI